MSKNSKTLVFGLTAFGLIALVVAGIFFLSQESKVDSAGALDATDQKQEAQADPVDAAPALTEYDPATAEPWVVEAMRDRVLGDPNAPVTMLDYSSLTCPHCADFHTNILPQLKNDYIDTGKVKLVFVDFPLNMPALQASALARCVKDDTAYFAYVDQLFRTQRQWGMTENAKNDLLGTIKFTGLSREDGARCIDNPQLISGILAKLEEAKSKYQIDSTPTFVLNDGKTIVKGAETYDHFKAAIDPLVK